LRSTRARLIYADSSPATLTQTKEVVHCLAPNLSATWYGQAIAFSVVDLGPNRVLRL